MEVVSRLGERCHIIVVIRAEGLFLLELDHSNYMRI
jgi:hypothetical protein